MTMAPDEKPAPQAAQPAAGESEAPDEAATYRRLQQAALAAVEYCLTLLPIHCLSDVDAAERAINKLRDRLIEGVRRAEPGAHATMLQDALDRTNIALSLIVGVEYPATGTQRKPLEMARDTLRDLHFEGLA
jgi:hypothetical protein